MATGVNLSMSMIKISRYLYQALLDEVNTKAYIQPEDLLVTLGQITPYILCGEHFKSFIFIFVCQTLLHIYQTGPLINLILV